MFGHNARIAFTAVVGILLLALYIVNAEDIEKKEQEREEVERIAKIQEGLDAIGFTGMWYPEEQCKRGNNFCEFVLETPDDYGYIDTPKTHIVCWATPTREHDIYVRGKIDITEVTDNTRETLEALRVGAQRKVRIQNKRVIIRREDDGYWTPEAKIEALPGLWYTRLVFNAPNAGVRNYESAVIYLARVERKIVGNGCGNRLIQRALGTVVNL